MFKVFRLQIGIVFSTFSLFAALVFMPTQIANAASPVVVVAKWDSVKKCVAFAHGAYDVDTYTRDALAGEWFSADPIASLRAGAVVIRSDAVHYSQRPEWTDSVAGRTCAGVASFYFNLRTSTFGGWGPGKGATDKGLANNNPNLQVTQTGGALLLQNQNVRFFPLLLCHHDEVNRLVNQGILTNYVDILTNPTQGLYRPSNPCGAASNIPNLSVNGAFYGFTKSMTNGTAPSYIQGEEPPFGTTVPIGGVRTAEVTGEGISRQAERYWGFAHMVSVGSDEHPEPEPGIYIKGTGKGDKVEYLYNFGGHPNTIRISGIDDYPAAVRVNIYVDGKFDSEMAWTVGDDGRRQISKVLAKTYPAGNHAVAIEFVEDYFVAGCPGDAPWPCDRNMYLDNFLVTNP